MINILKSIHIVPLAMETWNFPISSIEGLIIYILLQYYQ